MAITVSLSELNKVTFTWKLLRVIIVKNNFNLCCFTVIIYLAKRCFASCLLWLCSVSDRDVTMLLGASFKEMDWKPATSFCKLYNPVLRWQSTDVGCSKEGRLRFMWFILPCILAIIFGIVYTGAKSLQPRAGSGCLRIDLLSFLAGCCKRWLNQVQLALSVVYLSMLYIV